MTLARLTRAVLIVCLALGFNGSAFPQGGGLKQAEQLIKEGQLERALERINAYLADHPKDAHGRFLMGVVLTQQKKANEAIKVFTDLTYDYPELSEPYNNLAVLYAARGEYDKARTALEMAVRANPSYAVAQENLGDIYAKMAGRAYDKAAQLDRKNKTAPLKLKLVKELLAGSPAGK